MDSVSVVLATHNEEKNLKRCLMSVKDFASEIVIADGESKDKTVSIAKTFGAKIINTTNKPNFHINKQIAINKAKGDWVLQLDADEVVSRELTNEIKSVLTKKTKENGFWIPRKNYFLGRFLLKGGQYPDYTIRLYKNGKGKLPQKDVHEQAVVEGEVGYLQNPLLHFPYDNFSMYLVKWNRYNKLLASQIKSDMKKKSLVGKMIICLGFLVLRPGHWFLTTYIRHKGFYDSWQGFVFSFMSALRFPASFIVSLKK